MSSSSLPPLELLDDEPIRKQGRSGDCYILSHSESPLRRTAIPRLEELAQHQAPQIATEARQTMASIRRA